MRHNSRDFLKIISSKSGEQLKNVTVRQSKKKSSTTLDGPGPISDQIKKKNKSQKNNAYHGFWKSVIVHRKFEIGKILVADNYLDFKGWK